MMAWHEKVLIVVLAVIVVVAGVRWLLDQFAKGMD
jgi:hypothetical protein